MLIFGLGIVLLLGLAALYRGFMMPPPRPAIGGNFTLLGDHGQTVTQQNFHGRYTLIYFGYTHCVDVCPLTLATVSAALYDLGAKGRRVVPLFISVDPARDTPQVVTQYAANFSPDIVALTGTQAEINKLIAAYHVTIQKRMEASHPADYLMDHSSVLYLMNGDNQLVALLPVGSSAKDLAARLALALPAS